MSSLFFRNIFNSIPKRIQNRLEEIFKFTKIERAKTAKNALGDKYTDHLNIQNLEKH